MDTKEDIKHRILKHAARLWGYQESDMDVEAFDPVVNLLAEACATEMERIQRDVASADTRVVNRVIEMLTPDILTGPQPAHAITHARSLTPRHLTETRQMIFTQKKTDKGSKDIYFSPAGQYPIIDGDVRLMVVGKQAFQLEGGIKRSVFLNAKNAGGLAFNVLYLGLELGTEVKSPQDIRFFFNWRNISNREHYLHLLSDTEWSMSGRALLMSRGIHNLEQHTGQEVQSPFYKDFTPMLRHRDRIEALYQDHFISVHSLGEEQDEHFDFQMLKTTYPKEFSDAFLPENLGDFKEKLFWVRVEFPDYFPPDVLAKTECVLNCFPVINRRFYKEDNRLQENVNIIALRGEGFFLDIDRVYNQQEINYHAIPLTNIRNYRSGQYTLRKRGISKYESSDAAQSLLELTDRLRDESSAFAAYNYEYLNAQVRRLNQDINELEQRVTEKNASRAVIPFLVVKPLNQKDIISVEYWTCSGEEANQVPSGTEMELYAFSAFRRDSIQLITGSVGGRDPLMPSESGYVFRMALANRERVVTREDIKSFCWAEMGDRIQHIDIRRSFRVGNRSNEGIERVIEVAISPRSGQNPEEMNVLIRQLEKTLNQHTSSVLPIIVTLQANGS